MRPGVGAGESWLRLMGCGMGVGGASVGNDIGDEGAAALAETLETNTTVTTIQMHGASRRPSDVRARREAWGASRCECFLRSWDGRGAATGNFIGTAGSASISSSLRRNFTLRHAQGIPGEDVRTALASRYRIPHVRFLARTRALCLSGRGAGCGGDAVLPCLACSAPLWVLARVCQLQGK